MPPRRGLRGLLGATRRLLLRRLLLRALRGLWLLLVLLLLPWILLGTRLRLLLMLFLPRSRTRGVRGVLVLLVTAVRVRAAFLSASCLRRRRPHPCSLAGVLPVPAAAPSAPGAPRPGPTT